MGGMSFGPFVLDASAARLVRDGHGIRLRPQAFRVLEVLVRHSGRLLRYDELMAHAWRGVVVSHHTVDVTVAEVRRALVEYGGWVRHHSRAGYSFDVPRSSEQVRLGWHFWSLRTRGGFEQALRRFQSAADESPEDFRVYEGQAACYMMLAAYGIQPGRDLSPAFTGALRSAERLVGTTPELRCIYGQGLHMFERRLDEAESEFLQALHDRPTLALAHIGMTTLYATMGRLDAALESVERARQVDPLLPVLPAAEVAVRVWRREFDAGAALGARAVALQPYVLLGRVYYAEALEYCGRAEEALAQFRFTATLFGDVPWLRALEGGCLARMGRRQEAQAILDELDSRRATDYVDSYAMAVCREALGDSAGAFAELDRAVDENCVRLYAIDVDPGADPFRADRRWARLRSRLHGPRLAAVPAPAKR
jgi:DNA-binding winged helix-turn-helix (wHTH) protein/tetratricopeptide (TPR) repeat protein